MSWKAGFKSSTGQLNLYRIYEGRFVAMTQAALQAATIGCLRICLSQQSVSAGGRAHLPRLRMSRTHGSAAGPAPQHTNAQHNAHAQLSIEHVYYRRADACGEGGFGDSLGQTQPNGRAVPMRPSKLHRNPFSRHQGREPLALFRRRATRHGRARPSAARLVLYRNLTHLHDPRTSLRGHAWQ